MAAKEEGLGGMEWEARVSRRMHLYIEWVNSKGLLDGT